MLISIDVNGLEEEYDERQVLWKFSQTIKFFQGVCLFSITNFIKPWIPGFFTNVYTLTREHLQLSDVFRAHIFAMSRTQSDQENPKMVRAHRVCRQRSNYQIHVKEMEFWNISFYFFYLFWDAKLWNFSHRNFFITTRLVPQYQTTILCEKFQSLASQNKLKK